jgi:hypothetical protein
MFAPTITSIDLDREIGITSAFLAVFGSAAMSALQPLSGKSGGDTEIVKL